MIFSDIRTCENRGTPEDSDEKTYFVHFRSNHYGDVMLSG